MLDGRSGSHLQSLKKACASAHPLLRIRASFSNSRSNMLCYLRYTLLIVLEGVLDLGTERCFRSLKKNIFYGPFPRAAPSESESVKSGVTKGDWEVPKG